jgi:hypothetical protein
MEFGRGPKKPNGGSRLVKDKPKGKNERTIPRHEEVYQELLALGPLKPDALVCPNKDGKLWGHKGSMSYGRASVSAQACEGSRVQCMRGSWATVETTSGRHRR